MTQNITGTGHMHFSGSGADTIKFGRGVVHLYLNVSSSTTISFDGGNNFMSLSDGNHNLLFVNVKRVDFGAGTWEGVGISY